MVTYDVCIQIIIFVVTYMFHTLKMSDSDSGKSRNTNIKYEAFEEENGLLFTGNFLIESMKGI